MEQISWQSFSKQANPAKKVALFQVISQNQCVILSYFSW